jgi:hypothetical protein
MLGREIHSARGRALVGLILARKCEENTRWELIDRNRETGIRKWRGCLGEGFWAAGKGAKEEGSGSKFQSGAEVP